MKAPKKGLYLSTIAARWRRVDVTARRRIAQAEATAGRQPPPGAGGERYTAPMKNLRIVVIGLASLACTVASAQWQWIDKSGRKVYSDQPPPADVAEKNILRQPGGRMAAPAAAPSPAAPQAAPEALRLSGKDAALEEKKKKADAAEAAKKKAEEEKRAAARADSCARARRAKASLDSGVRLARADANGEREFLDEATRAAESKRMQSIIDADCK